MKGGKLGEKKGKGKKEFFFRGGEATDWENSPRYYYAREKKNFYTRMKTTKDYTHKSLVRLNFVPRPRKRVRQVSSVAGGEL